VAQQGWSARCCHSTDAFHRGYWGFLFETAGEQERETVEFLQVGVDIEARRCDFVYADAGPGAVPTAFDCVDPWGSGTFVDGTLLIEHVWFEEDDQQTYELSLSATLDPGGRFRGQGMSSKCACEFDVTGARQEPGEAAPELTGR
jgi:hypothetical protein